MAGDFRRRRHVRARGMHHERIGDCRPDLPVTAEADQVWRTPPADETSDASTAPDNTKETP